MRYLLLIGSENKTAAPPSPAEGQAMVQAFMRFSEEVRAAGKTVVSERLRPEDEASRVRVKAGQRQVTDGPFAETKEVLGGLDRKSTRLNSSHSQISYAVFCLKKKKKNKAKTRHQAVCQTLPLPTNV